MLYLRIKCTKRLDLFSGPLRQTVTLMGQKENVKLYLGDDKRDEKGQDI